MAWHRIKHTRKQRKQQILDAEIDKIRSLVDDACIRLIEHVDSVQIMVTFHAENGETTSSYEKGMGNFFKAWRGKVVYMTDFAQQPGFVVMGIKPTDGFLIETGPQ